MEVDWARHIVIGLVAMLAVYALATWTGRSPPDQRGWRAIRPGAMYGVGIGIVLALVYWTMISVAAAFGAGGAMPPMLAAWTPNLVFGAGAVYLLFTVRT